MDGEIVASYPNLAQDCLLGPAYMTGQQVDDATVTNDSNDYWKVNVKLTPDGAEVFNQLAEMCYSADPACPSKQLALVVDGVIVIAPVMKVDRFEGDIHIVGSFDEDEANELADAINEG